ncbi:MAG: hypothetical protein AAF436_18915 [Myxococcota bacterium]
MPRTRDFLRAWRRSFLCTALGGLMTLGACDSQRAFDSGSLALDLVLQDGNAIDEVQWRLTGGGMPPMEGSIDTSAPGATASTEIFGIPPGPEYRIALEAATDDGTTTCQGSAPFAVTAGSVTEVHVMLRCVRDPSNGAVRAVATFGQCAELTKVVVSPLQTSLGNDITLSAEATDANDDPIAFRWTATADAIGNPVLPQTRFTCLEAGQVDITIAVSDDDFVHCDDSWTVPVTCVDQGGTGGTGGGGDFPAAPVLADGPNMSDVFDPLEGDRALLQQDDMLLSTRADKGGDKTPTVFGIPTSNGEPETAFEKALADSSSELAMQTVRARLFNTVNDYVINIRSPKNETITVEALEWTKNGSTFEFKTVFSQTVPATMDVAQIFAVVDDFNRDGLDEIVFTPKVDEEVFVATAVNVNEPGELKIEKVPGARAGSFQGSRTTGDLNGDDLLEIIDLGSCQKSTSATPSTNSCILGWMTLCPTTVPSTVCANAPEGWSFVVPETSEVTISAPSGEAFPIVPLAIAAGDFSDEGRDQVGVLLPSVKGDLFETDNVIFGTDLLVQTLLYGFNESFEPTRIAEKTLEDLKTPDPIAFLRMEMRAGPLDWSNPADMMALGYYFGVGVAQIVIGGVVYFDKDMGALESVSLNGPSNATQLYDVGIGHYDLPLANCDGQGTPCPASNQNLQLVHLLQTDGNQVDAFIHDLVKAGDPGCASGTDPPYCLKQTVHPKVVNGAPGNQIALISGDFQGRGIVLGSPTVTRQTVKQPVLVLAVPPMHGERLRVKDFDQNLFLTDPNGDPDDLKWITGSVCDETTVAAITADTTCTFDFTIDGNTGNSQYQSSFTETMMNASMSSTDHHFAYSWGGSSTTSVDAQGSETLEVNELSAYVNVSASVTVGRTNSTARDNINGTYTDGTQTSTFMTAFDDTVVYVTSSQNVYRYPMLGQNCSPTGGNEGCTADWTGLQYYTISIPNQPTTNKAPGKNLEWFQPPWVPGNMLTYPANCAALTGMYGSGSTIDNPLKTTNNTIGGGDGNFARTFESSSSTTTMTTHGHSIFNDDTVSVTAGAGCVEKPDGNGAKVTETGNFQDTRDRSTLTNDTTTTTGSRNVEATWTDSLNWQQTDQFTFSSQVILNGLTSAFQSKQVQSVSTDPAQGAKPDESYISDGAFLSAYTVAFDDDSEWWNDSNKMDYYTQNIDVSLALPERIENVPGGTQPGDGDEAVTQCMDNGSSQKLQCAKMAFVDSSFDDIWGPCGDYFHMRSLFFSPQPTPPQSSGTMCSSESDCPYGEACLSGSCGRCTQGSDCDDGTCTNGTCIRFVNGLPSVPGGTGDTIVDGSKALIGVRVYNTSLEEMPTGSKVKVQIYGQEWDGEDRAKSATTGQPLPSFLVGSDTIELTPIPAFPSEPAMDSCDPDDAVYNWKGAFATWDTTGLAPQVAKTYVFWVLAWAEDSDGNLLGEVPNLGLCPDGATDCPCPKVDGVPTCTWMTDVKLETWSNNLGFYRKVFTVLPQATSEPIPLDEARNGGVYIDSLDIEGVRRVGHKLRVRARLRAQGGPANGVSVTFFDRDPMVREAVDEELVSYIPEGERRPVSISYTPTECGTKELSVEARDGRGMVTRGSRSIDIPCEETRVEAAREVDPSEIPSEGSWTSGQLALTSSAPIEVDLASATVVLERALFTTWGEELVRTPAGAALNDVALRLVSASDDAATYRGGTGGVAVEAVVTREDGAATISLSFEGTSIRPGLFCNTDTPQRLSTQLSIDDGVAPRVLVTASDAWQCDGASLRGTQP